MVGEGGFRHGEAAVMTIQLVDQVMVGVHPVQSGPCVSICVSASADLRAEAATLPHAVEALPGVAASD